MRGITSDSLMDGTLLSRGAIDMPNYAENSPIQEAPTTQSRDDSLPDVAPVPFPIAIVGMAMRLPGGVSNETEFWDFLINKRDGLCKVPEDRYNIDAFYDESKPGHVRTQHGYVLQNDIGQVDNAFFGISKTEAGKLDPQQRLLTEVIWECMENGGQTQWRGKKIGCYVGVFGEDWLDLMSKDVQNND